MIYVADPWAAILMALSDVRQNEQHAAESFVRQAQEYFSAAERAAAIETRPLLYYYSFLNLTKALALARRCCPPRSMTTKASRSMSMSS
jgi:hypothetical protein